MNTGFKHVYGPVPSRRLGRSLGVDALTFKSCSFDCVYCQLGRTTNHTIERKEYIPTADILDEVRRKLENGDKPEYISFAGSGETDVFGLVPVFELAAHFVKDIRGGDIFLALDGVVRSPSELAIHAVERTAFEGQGVHAERTAQTPGRNRAVHMFEASVHVLSFSRGIARVRCHAPEMARSSGFAFVRGAFDGFESPLAHTRVGGDGFPCLGIIPGKGIFPVPALGRQHEAFQKRGPRFRSFGELRLQGPDMLGIDVVGDLFIGMAP